MYIWRKRRQRLSGTAKAGALARQGAAKATRQCSAENKLAAAMAESWRISKTEETS